MDSRKSLSPGTQLRFPGLDCIVASEIGRGSNSIVYKGRYRDSMNTQEWHSVLIKELFPFHPRNAIYRAEDGSVICESDGETLWLEHRHSFENGNRIHLRMLESFPSEMGANINSFPLNNTYYSLLGYTGGRSLSEDQRSGTLSLRQIAVRLLSLLDSLACFHGEGYLHLDIAPDNILLLGSGNRERVLLIDYNSVHSLRPTGDDPSTFSIKTGYTAPEIRTGNYAQISPASDLYSITAVFYQSLTGTILTPFQMARSTPPDVSAASPMRGQPDTVLSMVEQILRRGLAALPRRRYRSIEEMRPDVEELIDRIDGVGITHCSLWEAGRRSVLRTVRDNEGFSYLLRESKLFSASVKRTSGELQPVDRCLSSLKEANGRHLFILGEGGAGKTTALLRFVLNSQEKYSPAQPAVLFLSLYGKKNANARLPDYILENLRFKTETNSFPEARQTLLRLLDTPIPTASGDLPTLVLLLDGMNEYQGPKDILMEDIQALSRLRGVRLLVSSRNLEEKLPLETVTLMGLQSEELRRILRENNLAFPESPELQKLLQNPLMLSILLRSAEAKGGQLLISSQEELLETYFSSLLDKELRLLAEDSDEHWQLEAAVRFVLPAVAEEVRRKGHPLTDLELLPLIERLFALTRKNVLFRLFPAWVGHSNAIRGQAGSAEEWYGLIVHRLLWKRLGLLIRLEQSSYQLPHQIIGDYLSAIDRNATQKLRYRQTAQRLCAVILSLVLLGAGFWGLRHRGEEVAESLAPYNADTAVTVLSFGEYAYRYASSQSKALHDLVESSYADADYGSALARYQHERSSIAKFTDMYFRDSTGGTTDSIASKAVAELLASGEVFEGNGSPLERKYWDLLIEMETQLSEDYSPLVDALTVLVNNESIDKECGKEYRDQLIKLAKEDAELNGILYYLVVAPNIVYYSEIDNSIQNIIFASEYQNKFDPQSRSFDDLQLALVKMQSVREQSLSDAKKIMEEIYYMYKIYANIVS